MVKLIQLPRDALALIFEAIYEAHEDNHIALSHTCRTFRAISFGLPFLWSSLDSNMLSSKVEAYLSRSGDTGLTIILHSLFRLSRDDRWARFIAQVLPHSPRWRKFVFSPGSGEGREFYTQLSRKLAGLELPMLESLSVLLRFGPSSDFVSENGGSKDVRCFYKDWKLTRLSNAVVLIPSSLPLFDFLNLGESRLTSLAIKICNSHGYHENLTISGVLEFLRLVPLLRDLQLSFPFLTPESTSGISELPVPLYELREFSIRLLGYCTESTYLAMQELVHTMQMPALVKYHCSIYMPSHILALRSAYSVKKLVVDVALWKCLEAALEAFPNIEELEVHKMLLNELTVIATPLAMYQLRQIYFAHCYFNNILYVEQLVDQIRGTSPQAGSLEKVILCGCCWRESIGSDWNVPGVALEWKNMAHTD